MEIQVVWVDKAQSDLKNIVEYLLKEWTVKEADAFLNRLDKVLVLIKRNYRTFKEINKKRKVRRCVVVPQISLFYKKQGNIIFIVRLFNNKQNPMKLKL